MTDINLHLTVDAGQNQVLRLEGIQGPQGPYGFFIKGDWNMTGGAVSCAYPLAATLAQIQSVVDPNATELLSVSGQTSSYTVKVTGTPASRAWAGPDLPNLATALTFDFSAGQVAMEVGLSEPAFTASSPLNSNSCGFSLVSTGGPHYIGFTVYPHVGTLPTPLYSYVLKIDNVAVWSLTDSTTPITKVALRADATAATLQLYINGNSTPETLSSSIYTTGKYAYLAKVFQSNDPIGSDAGQVLSMGLHSSASDITTPMPAGTKDTCGNTLPGGSGEATPPTGATVGDVYRVTVGGIYRGQQSSVGDLAFFTEAVTGGFNVTFVPQELVSQAALQAYAQPLNANLTAEAGLTGAADKVGYFTGVGAKALSALTSFGRSLIALTDLSSMKTLLGISNVDNTSDMNKPVSTAQQAALDLKLNSADYIQHYRGKFISEPALAAAIPTGNSGDYAIIDAGAGTLAQQAMWDDESGWVLNELPTSTTTDQITEGSSHLYFTTVRAASAALNAVLTGLSTATSTAIVSTDTVLAAFGKLQAQITANASAISGKQNAITTGSTAQYLKGDLSLGTFATDAAAAITTTTEGALIHGATAKTTPVDADEIGIVDSAASNILKKLTFDNLWAWISSKIAGQSTVWATLAGMAPASYTGQMWFVTNVGQNGSFWRSNGTAWEPIAPVILGVERPLVILWGGAPGGTATYSQVGNTITVNCVSGHNFTAALHNGFNIYFGGSTGGLAAAVFSNFTYISATSFSCTSAVSQTISGNVASNTAAYTASTLTVPGGSCGLGSIQFQNTYLENNNSANGKTWSIQIGGQTAWTQTFTTPVAASPNVIIKIVSTSVQLTASPSGNAVNHTRTTVNTANDFTLTKVLQLANAADWIIYEAGETILDARI